MATESIKDIINQAQQNLNKTYYFMSGLPRSGSTLLSAILNQNPRLYSGPSSPVVGIMISLENFISSDELFNAFPKPHEAGKIISGVLTNYYSDVDKPVIIDKNRSWVDRLHYIPGYFGVTPKVLCPVRNIDEILASFINMHRRNPYQINGRINFIDEMLIRSGIPLNDNERCKFIASSAGILGQSYTGIQKVIREGNQHMLHFIEYDNLVNNPKETMKKIYDFLQEEYYEHDFTALKNIHKENDAAVYGFADMHDVRPTVDKQSIKPEEILSKEIIEQCRGAEFWRDLELDYDNLPEDTKEESDQAALISDIAKNKTKAKIIGE